MHINIKNLRRAARRRNEQSKLLYIVFLTMDDKSTLWQQTIKQKNIHIKLKTKQLLSNRLSLEIAATIIAVSITKVITLIIVWCCCCCYYYYCFLIIFARSGAREQGGQAGGGGGGRGGSEPSPAGAYIDIYNI